MALVPDQKFSTFADGGNIAINDIVVGLRGGINTRFLYTGGAITSILGTPHQIIASSPTGNVLLSTPQDIDTVSSPTFAGLTLSSPLTVPNGGTGNSTFTAYSVICAGTTATGEFQNVSGLGTSGYVLTSNGASSLPAWKSVGSITESTTYVTTTPYFVLSTDQIILVDTVTIAAPSAVILPAAPTQDGQVWTIKDWSGDAKNNPISITVSGGGDIDGFISYDIGNNDEAVSIAWSASQSTYSVVYNYDTLIPVLRITTDSSTAVPTVGIITFTGSTTGLTTSASGSTVSLGGTLAISHGGTNVTSVTISPTATAFAGWDTNKNLSANNHINGFTTTATATSTTTLSVASTYIQQFTGTLTQTVVMPVANTLVEGQSFLIINDSSGVVTVQSSGTNTIQAMAASTTLLLTCILNSGTTAASWNATYIVDSGGGVSPGTANQLAYYATTGNNVSGLTSANSAVLTTSSSGVPAWSGTMTNGQLIIGSTTATPTAATLTAGSGITITNGAGSITISSSTSGMSWTTVTGTTQAASVNNGYITNNAGAVTVTLPTTFGIGDEVEIKGLGAGGWVLAAGTATTIRIGGAVTSSAGSLTSAGQYDTVKVTGLVANTTWSVDYVLSTGLTVA